MRAYEVRAYGVRAYGVRAYGVRAYGVRAYGVRAYGVIVAFVKHKALAPRETSSFVSPRPSMIPEANQRGTLRSRGNKTRRFPWDQSCSVLLYFSTLKKKKLRRNRLLDAGWLTNLPRFQEARSDHVRVESSSCYFPRKLFALGGCSP